MLPDGRKWNKGKPCPSTATLIGACRKCLVIVPGEAPTCEKQRQFIYREGANRSLTSAKIKKEVCEAPSQWTDGPAASAAAAKKKGK